MIQNDKSRKDAEKLGFTPEEHSNIQEYFNREIKKSDTKAVMASIEFMFKDIQNKVL